jgi:hypothetical protein
MTNDFWNLCCPNKLSEYLTKNLQISFVYTRVGYEAHFFIDDGFIYRITLDADQKLFTVYKVNLGVDCIELINTGDISLVKEKISQDIRENFNRSE